MQGVPDVVLSLTGAGADRRDSCTPHTGTTEMHAYRHTPETCAYHTVTCKVCLMLSSHWLVQVLTAETLAPHAQAPQKCMHTDTPQRRVHTTLQHARCAWCCPLTDWCRCWPQRLLHPTHRHHRNACIQTHTPETCAYHTATCKVCLMLSSHWLVQVLTAETLAPHTQAQQKCMHTDTHPRDVCIPHCNMQGVPDVVLSLTGAGADRRDSCTPHTGTTEMHAYRHTPQRRVHTTLQHARCAWCCPLSDWCRCWPQRLLHPTHRHHRNACIQTHPRDVCIPHCNMQGVPDVVLSLTGAGADRRDSCTPHTGTTEMHAYRHTPQRRVHTTLQHARCAWCCPLTDWCRCWPQRLLHPTHRHHRNACIQTHPRDVCIPHCNMQGVPDVVLSLTGAGADRRDSCTPHTGTTEMHAYRHTPQRRVHTTLQHARCAWCCPLSDWCRCWPQRLLHPTHRHHRNACIQTHTPETCAYHTATCKVCLMLSSHWLVQVLTAETLAPHTQAPQKCMHTDTHPRDVCIPHCNMQGVPDVVLSLTGAGADRRDSCTPHTGTTEMHAYRHTPETCAYHTATCKVCLMLSSLWLVQVLTAETLAPHTQAPQKCMHTDTPQRRVHTTLQHARCAWCCPLSDWCRCWWRRNGESGRVVATAVTRKRQAVTERLLHQKRSSESFFSSPPRPPIEEGCCDWSSHPVSPTPTLNPENRIIACVIGADRMQPVDFCPFPSLELFYFVTITSVCSLIPCFLPCLPSSRFS